VPAEVRRAKLVSDAHLAADALDRADEMRVTFARTLDREQEARRGGLLHALLDQAEPGRLLPELRGLMLYCNRCDCDCDCDGGDGGIGFGGCNCSCHSPAPRYEGSHDTAERAARRQELTEEGKAAVRDLVKRYSRRVVAAIAPQLAAHELGAGGAPIPERVFVVGVSGCDYGEPRTTDYCARCGESPESGTHVLGGHEYLDPRKFGWRGNKDPGSRAEPSMKMIVLFTVGRREHRDCRLVVGSSHCEVRSADSLGDPVWLPVNNGEGMPPIAKVLEHALARFAEDTATITARVYPQPPAAWSSAPLYPRGVHNQDGRMVVTLGDLTAICEA
jgi:hypothetical protein